MKAEISAGMVKLFELEIDNEHDERTGRSRSGSSCPGGENPATLGSCKGTLAQCDDFMEGYGHSTPAVIAELDTLIARFGPNTEVRAFLPPE